MYDTLDLFGIPQNALPITGTNTEGQRLAAHIRTYGCPTQEWLAVQAVENRERFQGDFQGQAPSYGMRPGFRFKDPFGDTWVIYATFGTKTPTFTAYCTEGSFQGRYYIGLTYADVEDCVYV